MKATITSLIFLLLSLTVSSQTYKYIGIEEGLSNQKIYKIQKDARGYMWFLTIIRKSKFPQNPKRSVRFSGKGTKRSVQKRKARNTQKAETKVL